MSIITLGDAFNRRKKVGAELEKWIMRLSLAGQNKKEWFTKSIDGKSAFDPEPGSMKETTRHYNIEECQAKIAELIVEDETLAMRISLTNQVAEGTITDLDGNERTLTIPALLVLRNEIIPKLEQIARSVPTRSENVNVIEKEDDKVVHRTVTRMEKKRETITDKGHKVEEREVTGYRIIDITEYGVEKRDQYDEVDRIQAYAASVKQAINDANKTELVELPA